MHELLELENSIRDDQTQIKSIKYRLIKNKKIIYKITYSI